MIPCRIGRYEIKSEVGRGGMATVYLAHDPRFKRDVALKILAIQFLGDPTFRARFEREAQMIAAIEHPAIVPVYDFGEEDGQLYLVMRYMPGGSLARRLKPGPFTLTQSTRIISRLAPALDAIHSQGVVHRDLKPSNILFDAYENAYISDFGIARLTQATVTLTGDAIIGTPSYMSPEQVRGEAEIDGRSDIYALGAILFEMVTGKRPFEATTPMGVAMKQVTEPVPRVRSIKSDLPEDIQLVIEKAMAKERDQRYATASELADRQQVIAATYTTRADQISSQTREDPNSSPTKADTRISAPDSSTRVDTPEEPHGAPAPQPGDLPPARPPRAAPLCARAARRGGIPISAWTAIGLIAILGVCSVLGLVIAGGLSMLPDLLKLGSAGTPTAQLVSGAATQDVAKQDVATQDVGTQDVGTQDDPALNPEPADLPRVTPVEGATDSPAPRQVDSFQDDFSDPTSGWYTGTETGTEISYHLGGYRILVDHPNIIAWATPNLIFQDVSIEVDATKIAGADENYFGILCRYQDEQNFYILAIGSDGYYVVGKYKNGEFELIDMEHAQYSGAIHKGRTTNRIRADCVRNTLTLYVNSIKLIEVDDDDFASGDVGLTAAAFDIGNTNILFDNFIAQKP